MTPRQKLFHKFPYILTENLFLRKLGLEDINNLDSLFNSVDTQKYQEKTHYSFNDLYDYVESQNVTYHSHEILKWVFELKNNFTFVGVRILYCDDDSGWIEIQGDTKKEFWGMGYTKEAYLGIIEHLKKCGFIGIYSKVQDGNENAIGLLKSLGFVLTESYLSNEILFHKFTYKIN